MTAFDDLVDGMRAGTSWHLMGQKEPVRELLGTVLDDRIRKLDLATYQFRVNLQTKPDSAAYAGLIVDQDNPTSGPYQGTSFVWFPGETGSVAALVIGTDGFGADTAILGRPGHGRRLRAVSRAHDGRVWVKPDLLDITTDVPDSMQQLWPAVPAAMKVYARVIYAATPVRPDDPGTAAAVADLLDLFLFEHRSRFKGAAQASWDDRLQTIHSHVFPERSVDETVEVLRERRFVILEGPPGTGKTRRAREVADVVGSSEMVQFHPARTYEDFVVGLYPQAAEHGLAFQVREGDLLRANRNAQDRPHVLIIDEINRADLGRVLGEAVSLFEPGEPDRSVRLPHAPPGHAKELQLSENLLVIGTRNTADRSIARMDLAIRRRFAFIEMWPSLKVVADQGDDLATEVFGEVLSTFIEYASEDGLRLVPGHAYLLDPPALGLQGRTDRLKRRITQELVPLLRDYVAEQLLGSATLEVAGLADRIEARVANA